MKERQLRLAAIKSVIRKHKVDNQETLLRHLESEGYQVTQATLSRDLKLLKVGKQADGHDGYFYSLPNDEIRREQEDISIEDFKRGYVSLDFTAGLAVIKTLTGHAGSVALAIDNLAFACVLGTVAGDDTVMVAIREGCGRNEFVASIREVIPGFVE